MKIMFRSKPSGDPFAHVNSRVWCEAATANVARASKEIIFEIIVLTNNPTTEQGGHMLYLTITIFGSAKR